MGFCTLNTVTATGTDDDRRSVQFSTSCILSMSWPRGSSLLSAKVGVGVRSACIPINLPPGLDLGLTCNQ
jgi:hypothetical protein